mgnify:CR=1 FL=1
MKAIWNEEILAESNETVEVEGNQYFPPDSINDQFFKKSEETTVCPWKGTAHYYHLEVNGKRNEDAAWYYPKTKPLANKIENHVAFWKGVEIVER